MKFREFFASSDKKSHLSARVMARTVQLLRHDAYCPISAEIGTIDSQSDLRIGGAKCRVHSQARKLPVREKLNVVSFILVSDLLSLKTQRVLKGLWKNLVGKNQLTLLAFFSYVQKFAMDMDERDTKRQTHSCYMDEHTRYKVLNDKYTI